MNKEINIQKHAYTKPVFKEFGKMQIVTKDNSKTSAIDNATHGHRGNNKP